jgi:hypothetical protein
MMKSLWDFLRLQRILICVNREIRVKDLGVRLGLCALKSRAGRL